MRVWEYGIFWSEISQTRKEVPTKLRDWRQSLCAFGTALYHYDATVTDLVNASLEHLIESEQISLYKKAANDFSVTHTLLIRESNLAGLEDLKAKYGVSIYKLVNIAIKNVLDEYDSQRR